MSTATLVVELFTEELPPKALKRLGEAFADGLFAGLAERGFTTGRSVVKAYATPRRLAVAITDTLATSPDQPVVEKLMPASVAFDATGKATIALQRRLDKAGRGHLAALGPSAADGADRLTIEPDGKADAVFLRSVAKGSPLQSGLQAALADTLERLPIPKVMSYASRGTYYNDAKFVRPAHRLVALFGDDVVDITALGLKADRVTGGHRALARADLRIATAEAYEETLRAEGKVIASFAERRNAIASALAKAAAGAAVIMPDALLDEVTALVEWPVVLGGLFDKAFLAVPQECLILTMQQNQKYFALADSHGKLLPRFLLVANLETRDPAAIVEGNERVLRARLADARFFFDQDRKTPLAARVPRLATIVYHNKLGTQLDRVARVERLAGEFAPLTRADRSASERAAHLAKADLTTDMVGEFPELQGLMGRYYATHDGEPAAIAAAIEQHYWPRYAGDGLPEGPVAQAVALADKLEALAGLFGVGAQPTGDKDPFALRRQAIGVIRILVEKALPIALPDLIDAAFRAFADRPAVTDARAELASFVYERLRAHLREAGYSANEAEAVLSQRPARIDLVPVQAAAVRAFSELPEAGTLAGANKRIINILRKSESEAAQVVDRGRLTEGAEHELYLTFQKLEPIVANACAAGDFAGALLALATAKPAVDRFFDDVLVMADDPAVRANRLALLRGVAQTMNRVADISKLAA
ncbi:MAG TPA: glycine--tRNA ligase subunit beta [Casimicrobiaceae bacterium]|nr:glycine--tRNA ligase subunit beta [Casimicrobiaceae bacterium]